MKRKGIILLALLALALAAAPALAGTVTMTQNHDFSLAFGLSDPNPTLSATVFGVAEGSSSEGPSSASDTQTPPATATASLPSLSYLVTTLATTSHDSNTVVTTMYQNMVGNAPDSLSGYLFQSAFNSVMFTFTADTTGTLAVSITDSYYQTFGLTNNTVDPSFFTSLAAYSDIYLTLTDVTGGNSLTDTANILTYEISNPLLPLDDFAFSEGDPLNKITKIFSFNMAGVQAGDTITLEIVLNSTQDGTSSVPLPSTVALLGSGLAGLFLLRGQRLFRP